MVQEQLGDAKSRMSSAVEALQNELATVRTGRASVGIVEHVKIDYYGTSTPLNDKTETLVIKQVFGQHAYQVPVSATKSMIGHLIGAAGAVELIATTLALEHQCIPPTINYEIPDPACDLDYVPNVARKATINFALKNSFGFGGKNSALVIKRYEP